ncbi:MAG: molybdopterin-synthase adenylyltransferase MoeB [Bacillota bacterium]
MRDDTSLERYARQVVLPEIGPAGQDKLARARVLIVGAGGLGSPAAFYLAAAGVGTLGIADADVVEVENLQRQILHRLPAVGRPKTASAAATLGEFNPGVRIVEHPVRVSPGNALEILASYDIVVDAADNLATKYLLNDACFFLDRPLVHGAVLRFEGQLLTVIPRRTPCFRCLFPAAPPAELSPPARVAGILGTVPGVIGALQANEAVKLVVGAGEPAGGRLILFDALATRFREVRVARNPRCPLCGENPTIREPGTM